MTCIVRINIKKAVHGYTLFEILLVLVVLSAISSLAILHYRLDSQTERTQKAAAETQHVLESALAYYVDHQQWPQYDGDGSHARSPDCAKLAVSDQDPFKPYLANQSNASSMGGFFCWGPDVDSPHLFWAALLAPGKGPAMARRIAGQLPNAVITPNPLDNAQSRQDQCAADQDCYVRSEVPLPAAVPSPPVALVQVAAIGYCLPDGEDPAGHCHHLSGGDYVIDLKCAGEAQGEVVLTPNFWSAGVDDTGQSHFSPSYLEGPRTLVCNGNCNVHLRGVICYQQGSEGHLYPVCAEMSANPYGGYIGATYVAVCRLHKTVGQ